MAAERIEYVLLKDGMSISEINLESMTKAIYKEKKEQLFCPNSLCSAKIEYCEGAVRVYFRTKRSKIDGKEIIEQHIDGCPYGIEHQTEKTPKVIYDPNIGFLISDNHVLESMKRAYNQYIDSANGKVSKGKSNQRKGNKRNNEVNIGTNNEDVVVKGKGVLGKQENTEKSQREPNLYQRFIDDINKKDLGKPRLVKGVVSEINYKPNSITIALNTVDGRTARMHFSEDFKVNNEAQFIQMSAYKHYFDFKKTNNQETFIICAGDVTNDSYDVSVQVRSYSHIFIDGMTHYQLIVFINEFIN